MTDWSERSREELIAEVERLEKASVAASRGQEVGANRFRAFFEESFVPFWLEDWSFVAEYVHGLFDSGVEDLEGYFSRHPESLTSCLDMVRLVDANEATLRFFGLAQKEQMLSDMDNRITPWARRTFVAALVTFLSAGERRFEAETTLKDSEGELKRLLVHMHVPEVHACNLAQVHISATDITRMRAVEARLARRRSFERTIGRLAGAFVFPENLEDVIDKALHEIGRLSEASRAYLMLFDERYERISAYHEWCAEGIPSSRRHLLRLPLTERPWYFNRLLEEREILIEDVSRMSPEASLEKAAFEAQGIRSLVAIPVFIGDRLEGVVGFDDVERTQSWGQMALEQLRMFCGMLGSAIHGWRKNDEVRAQNAKLDALFKAAEDVGFVTADTSLSDLRITGFSPGAEKIFGYRREEILGRPVSSLHDALDSDELQNIRASVVEQGRPFKRDVAMLRSGGESFPARVSIYPLRESDQEQVQEVLGVVLDLSSVRRVEEELRESRERLELALDAARDGIWDWLIDEDQVFLSPGWYRMMGLKEEGALPFSDWMSFVNEKDREEFLKRVNLHLAGEIEHVEIPIRLHASDGRWLWVLARGRLVRRDSSGAPNRMVGTQVDISELKTAQEKLEAVNEQITATLARIVEARDVYTAGHQQRTSRLAESIARELELPDEEIGIVRTAALLHDIGKIVVPTEILNKPGKLSDLEWNLIRIHPEEGASLLKDVPFPSEVAETVRQHHERWNGSGYPRGLKKEKILLPSRILAVADVVETMASHRPYRPEKGLDQALEELEKGRGKAYDPRVVDACLTLFREKGYSLEG